MEGVSRRTDRQDLNVERGPSVTHLVKKVFVLCVLISCWTLVFSSVGHARFTRPFVRHIAGTPTGPAGTLVGFPETMGLAVDPQNAVWVAGSGGPPFQLSKFSYSADEFVENLEIAGSAPPVGGLTPPESIAIARATGDFYTTGHTTNIRPFPPSVEVFTPAGTFARRWPVSPFARVAVDNSAGLNSGDVYVDSSVGSTVERFSANGEKINFASKGPCIENNRIVGTPIGAANCEAFDGFERLQGIAVDEVGDIYVDDLSYSNGVGAVVEFSNSGAFVRAFVGEDTPGLEGGREFGGFGGRLEGVAIDPVSKHLLVSLSRVTAGGGQKTFVAGAVDEFDLESGRFLNQFRSTEVEGSGGGGTDAHLSGGGEVATDSHGDVYVVDQGRSVVDVYGPGHYLPTVMLDHPSGLSGGSAVVSGTVNPESLSNPEKTGLTECAFQYVTRAMFEVSGFASAADVPCEPGVGVIPGDSSAHAVSAEIGGLAPSVVYVVRLVASTGGVLGGEAGSVVGEFTEPGLPVVSGTAVSGVSSIFARLSAGIDPEGAGTAYHFEYDTRPYGSSEEHGVRVPLSDVAVGRGGTTGDEVEAVGENLSGLSEGTVYYFRAVATNEAGTAYGPEVSFATLSSSIGLPDGRAYELVTPPNKEGGSDMFGVPVLNSEYFNTDVAAPSEDGTGLVLSTHAGFGAFPGNEESAYVFGRHGTTWTTTSLASPALGVQNLRGNFIFEPDGVAVVGLNDDVGSGASEAGSSRETLVGPPGGPYETLHVDAATHDTHVKRTQIAGASHDLSHIVVESPSVTLCAGGAATKHGEEICEFDGGKATIVDVNGEGQLLGTCGAVVGGGAEAGLEHDAVSPDGTGVVFTAPDPQLQGLGVGCWAVEKNGKEINAPQLYFRSGSRTVTVSAPANGASDPTGSHYAEYVGASEDDSRIFFVSEGWLTADHPSGHDRELYECAIVESPGGEGCELTRVSSGEAGVPSVLGGAGVDTVPAVAASGAAVYFTASGALVSGAEAHGASEGDAPVNLYRYDTRSRQTRLVGVVGTADYPNTQAACEVIPPLGVHALCGYANWYTTPSGQYLLFASASELDGASTAGQCVLPNSTTAPTGHCDEVYRYDAASERVTCVSCDPSGAAPVSNSLFARSAPATPSAGSVRAMSDDGAYVFFDTADALVPADSNGTLDVYEWHNGRIALISSGHDAGASFFLGYSPEGAEGQRVEGGNVFFGTHARLVTEDSDASGDIYDARICTLPEPCASAAVGGTAQCEGDACQTPPQPPADAVGASAIFSGVGNVLSTGLRSVSSSTKLRNPTRQQLLAKALKVCAKKPTGRRRACVGAARRRYGGRKESARQSNDVVRQNSSEGGRK